MGRRGKFISDREERIVCSQYLQNWGVKEIAASASLSQTTVYAILKKRGIPLKDGKKYLPKRENQVVDMYLAGDSIAIIKETTGIRSEQTIYRILRDADVPRRRQTKK